MEPRGVSSVIATILLVGVVVILGSVLSIFTLGIAEDLDAPAPQASFDFDWEKSTRTLTIRHEAGDVFDQSNTERLEVVIRDEDETGQNDFLIARGDWANQSDGRLSVRAGDTFVITGERGGGDIDVERDGADVDDDSETHEPEIDDPVQIIWYGTDGTSFVVSEYVIKSGEDP
ncbi:type IV pilin [Haloarcula sp. Atlit-47R]|uniref:type IV pilin n=1 Tax=Haloarcula sp. Atlit-47R TaxID=2282132 RepID=UPI000EF26561|nr:type IV pilin N-terminal domain-containing protein [Haloarcula sp. Atlit-47R]RLM42344.1 type IV pilin [Haloarcula sp. Atlit-47R]